MPVLKGKMKNSDIRILLVVPFLVLLTANVTKACPACWAGYGPGMERFNKSLADLRTLYENQGTTALPEIREQLKTTNDPMIQQRALVYITELKDMESVPVLEDLLLDLTKRVAFTTFGVTLDPGPYQTRLKIAHTLATLGSTDVADKIWKKYDRMDPARKSEVPYILNALADPELCIRLMEIIKAAEDYQLMIGALNVLAMGGDQTIVSFLQDKVLEWKKKQAAAPNATCRFSAIEYSVLKIKADQTVFQIRQRIK